MEIENEVLEKIISKLDKGEIDFGDLRKEMQYVKEIAIVGVSKNIKNLNSIISKFENDVDIAKIAVSHKGELLKFFGEEIKSNKEIVDIALNNNLSAIQYAGEKIRDDEILMKQAVINDPNMIMFASERLKQDKDFMLLGLERKIELLKHVPEYAPQLELSNEILIKILHHKSALLNSLYVDYEFKINDNLLLDIYTFCEEIYNQLKKNIPTEDFDFILEQYARLVYSGELIKEKNKEQEKIIKKTSKMNKQVMSV